MTRDTLTPPCAVRSNDDAYWLEDAHGIRFAFTYFRDPRRGSSSIGYPDEATARRFTEWLAKSAEAVKRSYPPTSSSS